MATPYRLSHDELKDGLPDLEKMLQKTYALPLTHVNVTASPYGYPSTCGLPTLGIRISFMGPYHHGNDHRRWIVMMTGVGPMYGLVSSLPLGVRAVITAWFNALRAARDFRQAKKRLEPIKEELLAAAWAPERVARWLEAGIDPEDM